MTRNEKAIKLISMIDVCDGELHVHTHWGSFDDDMKEALRFAIKGLKSLEEWERVKEEIEKAYEINVDYMEGLTIAENIIDSHLSEVSE